MCQVDDELVYRAVKSFARKTELADARMKGKGQAYRKMRDIIRTKIAPLAKDIGRADSDARKGINTHSAIRRDGWLYDEMCAQIVVLQELIKDITVYEKMEKARFYQ